MSEAQTPSDPMIATAIAQAAAVRSRARAPYSGFAVGAAAVLSDGSSFVGCNVESASYGLTLCAERSALAAMFAAQPVGDGDGIGVVIVAIVTGAETPTPPCGACRQWLAEFAPGALVVAETTAGAQRRWTVSELLPDAFNGDDLRR